jgi:hypothetical protein
MDLWRGKLFAFGVHFLITLLLAALAAALIFLIWFPNPFQTMMGGDKLFLLIVGCDLALGPLISLVIYNSKKPRKELIFDYVVVGVVQLAALAYGVYVMSGSRPIYVAHVKDRLEVVTAADIEETELQAAKNPEYRSRPIWGPKFVGTLVPPEEEQDALFTALAGKDVSVRPRFFVDYPSMRAEILRNAKPLTLLEERHASAKPAVAAAQAELGIPEERLRWLPIKLKRAFWTVLIDSETGYPVKYLEIDPY